MFDAIFGRSVKILKLLAKVQCVLAFVLASMLCGSVHEMLKPFSRFSAIVLGLVLGGMCEEHFSRAYLMNRANVGKALFGTPIAAVVMTACILMLLSPLYMPWIKKLISRKKA